MPNLTADPDTITVDDTSDVRTLLKEMYTYQQELVERNIKLQEELETVKQQHEPYIERREDAIQARREAILDFAQDAPDALLAGTDGKTFDTPWGAVRYRSQKPTVEWDSKKKAIQELKEKGYAHHVVQRETLHKSKLKKLSEIEDICDQMEHLHFVPAGDTISVSLNNE